ncbi:sporulation protein [Mechercharimyces sp. CAU 1602]|uniref:sporulation protein n=1 Tax=Mechercharimyces sp. CAU 1602 TaxID=2973933 RepID=UPI0021635E3C|nr:sporulation protein [Mechercharimyces sp. CAU 1602]MCS1352778.1 sporulation protein [Mechercharimyces sp. CAU 1602]
MSFFSKALASMGIGAARVDSRLEKSVYHQGETIFGEIYIQGGQVRQKIDEIYLYLIVRYHEGDAMKEYKIDEYRISEIFEIGPQENRVVPFEIQLPYDTPLTTTDTLIYLKTGLDIQMAINPNDEDGIEVRAHSMVERIVTAIESVGFHLEEVECELSNHYSRYPFVQEFKFEPNYGYKQDIDELEVIFHVGEHQVEVDMEIDRKASDWMGSLEEALALDERIVRFTVLREDVEERSNNLELKIRDILEEHV